MLRAYSADCRIRQIVVSADCRSAHCRKGTNDSADCRSADCRRTVQLCQITKLMKHGPYKINTLRYSLVNMTYIEQ